jgi:hypothetical protein
MIKSLYDLVMNPEHNPLRTLPKMVRFQFMVVLAYMWSVVFSIYVGVIALAGPSIVAHTILLVGVYFTADIFGRAQKRALSYDETFKDPRDGGAMYDDVWGAPASATSRTSS